MMKSMDEKKGLLENIKAEEIPMSNSTFSDQIPTSATFAAAPNFIDIPIPSFEGGGGGGGGSWESFGFTDMLTNFLPDNPFTSVYDFVFQNPQTNFQSLLVRQPTPTPPPRATNNNDNNNNNAPPESSEVVNTPATPNSSSISTSSSEAQNDDQQNNKTTVDGEQEDQDQEKTKKQLKPIKKNQKRKKEPRFAFVTKSEVDQLDDGYRWRKYGQKAVKNSPFPRSYYRCTSPSCGVKKRVERSSTDPTTVVTTYEGTHIHPIPLTSRGSLGFVPETTASSFFSGPSGGGGGCGNSGPSSFFLPPMPPRYQQQQHQQLPFFQEPSSASSFVHMIQESGYCPPPPPLPSSSLSSALFMDNGLLEDIVPSQMLIKELKKE